MKTKTGSLFKVHCTADRMSATIEVRNDAELSEVTDQDVVAVLTANKVVVTDDVTQRIEEYIEALRSPEGPPQEAVPIAQGRPVIEGQDGTFTWEDALQKQATDWADDAPVDFYNISAIVTVQADAVIGRITPPIQGTDGVNVFGQPLRPKGKPQEVQLKDGVELDADGVTVRAVVPGRVVDEDHELWISEIVEIPGDVNFETGNLDLSIDGMIQGSIRDRFEVATQKNLTVTGAVEAAQVKATGNVTVRGGILNRRLGKVIAGREITAKFCEEADLKADGDIRMSRLAMNSNIHTVGKLLIHCGSIVGGNAYAKHGVEVGTLGCDAGTVTEIAVGLHPQELWKLQTMAQENENRKRTAAKIRQTIGPLAQEMKRLNNEQRERVTELMFQADTIDAEIAESEQEAAAMKARIEEAGPYVLVNSMIYPRVSITISDRVVAFHEEMKGPIKIERRKISNYTAIAAVNPQSGSVQELKARSVELNSDPTVSEDKEASE